MKNKREGSKSSIRKTTSINWLLNDNIIRKKISSICNKHNSYMKTLL